MDAYQIVTDPGEFDIQPLHEALVRLYACEAIPLETLRVAVDNSLNFAALSATGDLAGYVRVVTDKATFARLCDAFVHEQHRGRGVSRLLVHAVSTHAALKNLPLLAPAGTAVGFYEHCGLSTRPYWMPLLELVRTPV